MEISSAEFCKLTVQDVADLLVDKLESNDKEYSCAKVLGKVDDQEYELCVVLREVDE